MKAAERKVPIWRRRVQNKIKELSKDLVKSMLQNRKGSYSKGKLEDDSW